MAKPREFRLGIIQTWVGIQESWASYFISKRLSFIIYKRGIIIPTARNKQTGRALCVGSAPWTVLTNVNSRGQLGAESEVRVGYPPEVDQRQEKQGTFWNGSSRRGPLWCVCVCELFNSPTAVDTGRVLVTWESRLQSWVNSRRGEKTAFCLPRSQLIASTTLSFTSFTPVLP